MPVTRKITIWSPAAKLAGTPDLVISRSAGELVTYEDLGQLRYEELTETGVLTLQDNAAESRLYTFSMGDSIEKTTLLNYLRILQKRGDGAIPVQKGQLRFRDEFWRFDTAEIVGVNFRTAVGTAITVSGRSLTYYEAPCYLLLDGPWRSRLGRGGGTEETSGEGAEFAILERINPIESDGITTQLAGTIRITYLTFTVDFTTLSNPYVRQPVLSPEITYSIRQTANLGAAVSGTYKQVWAIQGVELTQSQLVALRSLLSRWRADVAIALAANTTVPAISLIDLTSQIAEPSPPTRSASGAVATVGGIAQYFGVFSVGQSGAIDVSSKEGDNTKVIVGLTLGEL